MEPLNSNFMRRLFLLYSFVHILLIMVQEPSSYCYPSNFFFNILFVGAVSDDVEKIHFLIILKNGTCLNYDFIKLFKYINYSHKQKGRYLSRSLGIRQTQVQRLALPLVICLSSDVIPNLSRSSVKNLYLFNTYVLSKSYVQAFTWDQGCSGEQDL